jgi:cell division protein FtsL|nr:cell division protein FtsL [uncultured Halomonas sp.]
MPQVTTLKSRGSWPLTLRLGWRQLLLALLLVLVLISALAVTTSAHLTRVQYARLQQLELEQDQLQTIWGRLLLEESTWSAPSRIERLARERLEMQVPDINDVEVIRP